jgi:hypothetical protein
MFRVAMSTVSLLCVAVSLGACTGPGQSSFTADVQPLLDKHCASCHLGGEGTQASGFDVATYESLMIGTHYGPVVVPRDAASSSLYRLVSGKVDPSIQMPHGQVRLSETQIAVIESWIDQGAKNN